MRWKRNVIDTNVIVSGAITRQGNPGRILDLLLAGRMTILYDERILGEYDEVLRRPKFGLNPRDVASLVAFIRAEGELIAAEPLAVSLPDADELPFLEVADSGGADALITGNVRHFQPISGAHRVSIVTPVEFLAGGSEAGD